MIIGIGETVYDIIFRDDQPQRAVPGGSTFNALISLGRMLGKGDDGEYRCVMITETGDDHIGQMIIRFMEHNNVSPQYVAINRGTKTHISLAFLDENNDAQYEFYKDHASANLKNLDISNLTFHSDDIVLFGSFFAVNPVIRDKVRSLLRAAHDAGATLYYDVNFRKNHQQELPLIVENIIENYRLATVVRGSNEDFRYLYGSDDIEQIYHQHIEPYCKKFICTCGGEPIMVFDGKEVKKYAVSPIETVSTIGAGDNFNAGYIYGLKSGLSQDEIIATAQEFSSAVCQSLQNYVGEEFVNSHRRSRTENKLR